MAPNVRPSWNSSFSFSNVCYRYLSLFSTDFSFPSPVEDAPPTILIRIPSGSASAEPGGELAVFPGSTVHLECLFSRRLGSPDWTWTSPLGQYLTGKVNIRFVSCTEGDVRRGRYRIRGWTKGRFLCRGIRRNACARDNNNIYVKLTNLATNIYFERRDLKSQKQLSVFHGERCSP